MKTEIDISLHSYSHRIFDKEGKIDIEEKTSLTSLKQMVLVEVDVYIYSSETVSLALLERAKWIYLNVSRAPI